MSSALHQYVHRPQQMLLRKAMVQVHLWAGLLVALYIVAIGVSGSILVYKDELMPRPHFAGVRPDITACTPAQLLAAIQVAEHAYPAREAVVASCPTGADPFFAVALRAQAPGSDGGQLTVYVHPFNGSIAGTVDQDASWMGVLYRFHIELLLKHNGRQWNGVGGAVLLLLAISGMFLWWPGLKNWSRGFKISLRSRWKRLNWDLHSAVGIWTVLFTLTWALTGVYFAWPGPFESAIQAVSAIPTARYPVAEMDRIAERTVVPSAAPLDVRAVLERAIAASHGAHLEGLFFGSGPKPILTVYMARKALGDYANTDFLYFDQRSGELLYTWRRGVNRTVGDSLVWLTAPMHFGTSFGWLGKLVWAIAGLALPVLTVTGVLMDWNRYLHRWLLQARRAKSAADALKAGRLDTDVA